MSLNTKTADKGQMVDYDQVKLVGGGRVRGNESTVSIHEAQRNGLMRKDKSNKHKDQKTAINTEPEHKDFN